MYTKMCYDLLLKSQHWNWENNVHISYTEFVPYISAGTYAILYVKNTWLHVKSTNYEKIFLKQAPNKNLS